MRFTTDKFHAVGDLVILEIGMEIPEVHPFGHDAQVQALSHLDSLDCQDIFVFDMFGNQHLLAESLKVTSDIGGPDTCETHTFFISGKSSCGITRRTLSAKTTPSVLSGLYAFQTSENPPVAFGLASCFRSENEIW
jgi:hypothetical protein